MIRLIQIQLWCNKLYFTVSPFSEIELNFVLLKNSNKILFH